MESVCCVLGNVCVNDAYPWAKKSFYEPSLLGLNEQIQDFIEWIAPTEEEIIMRRDVYLRVERVVTEMWAHSKVEPIGSTCTNLCVPTSDIDLVIFGVNEKIHKDVTNPNPKTTPPKLEDLYKLAKRLEKIAIKNSVEVLNTAKVPIIKMRDIKSSIEVDISFGICTGKENTKLIAEYCGRFPQVRPLALIIKYYLKQNCLNNSWSGGIGSYTLVIMIISYLQLYTRPEEHYSLVELLSGFFKLYGELFNYRNHVISIRNSGCYFSKEEKKWANKYNPELLSVEDPCDNDSDVGIIAFKIENAREAFYNASNILVELKTRALFSGYTLEELNKICAKNSARPIHECVPGERFDIPLSKLIWVHHSLNQFRSRIKDIYGGQEKEYKRFAKIQKINKSKNGKCNSNNKNFNNTNSTNSVNSPGVTSSPNYCFHASRNSTTSITNSSCSSNFHPYERNISTDPIPSYSYNFPFNF